MISVEKLKLFGAKADEGLQRCMGNEALYLRLVGRFLEDSSFANLKAAIEVNDLEKAFQLAHALKGVLGNLSLTPLYDVIYELTELLRNKVDRDYSEYIEKYESLYNKLLELNK